MTKKSNKIYFQLLQNAPQEEPDPDPKTKSRNSVGKLGNIRTIETVLRDILLSNCVTRYITTRSILSELKKFKTKSLIFNHFNDFHLFCEWKADFYRPTSSLAARRREMRKRERQVKKETMEEGPEAHM
jgi:hypothetical protein